MVLVVDTLLYDDIMTTHIFLLFSFKSSSFASVRFKWPWRQNRIYQAKPVVRFQFINHNNFLNIQCYSIRCIYTYSTIYIPYLLYIYLINLVMDINSTHFLMMHILFFAVFYSINSSITKNVACYLIRQDEETKELIESEFLLYCALPSRV